MSGVFSFDNKRKNIEFLKLQSVKNRQVLVMVHVTTGVNELTDPVVLKDKLQTSIQPQTRSGENKDHHLLH